VHVLVVAGDGTRVVRVALPRRLMRALALIVLIGVGGSIGLLVDNVSLRRQAQHRPAAVPTVVADAAPAREETQAQLDAVRARLASMRSEIASWNELHAGIWRPLGPDAARGRAATGVGGAAAAVASASPVPLPIEAQLTRIAESLAEERQRLQALAKFMAGPGSMLRMLPSHWPLRGAVNSEFGRRLSPWSEGTEFHGGIDIAARPGTSVKAPAPGTVRFAGHSPGYGTTVILDHGREVQTLFGHLRDIGVRAGQRVERGQAIATSGDSGRATGPHLHYEILVQGRPVNPRGYLWE
jgi:murein DD-endopeptidase MepM/ murein hydrolase activator NlpD